MAGIVRGSVGGACINNFTFFSRIFSHQLHLSLSHLQVTLVFLEALGKPVHADLCSEHDFDDAVSRIKESIDHAGLHPLWTLPGRSRIRSGFALLGYDTEGLASNVLRALDALRDEAHAKLGVRPTLHILYNAAAHGFSSTFNLSNNRVALPRYLACGQRELPENESLTGLKGFPSVATYPPGETCPQEVVALLAPMPLMDAGNAALSPSRVVVEEVDRFRDERSREQRLRAMSLRRVWHSVLFRFPRNTLSGLANTTAGGVGAACRAAGGGGGPKRGRRPGGRRGRRGGTAAWRVTRDGIHGAHGAHRGCSAHRPSLLCRPRLRGHQPQRRTHHRVAPVLRKERNLREHRIPQLPNQGH